MRIKVKIKKGEKIRLGDFLCISVKKNGEYRVKKAKRISLDATNKRWVNAHAMEDLKGPFVLFYPESGSVYNLLKEEE